MNIFLKITTYPAIIRLFKINNKIIYLFLSGKFHKIYIYWDALFRKGCTIQSHQGASIQDGDNFY